MWETIKQILRKNKTTCIIVEEGKPSFVVTPFDEYKSLLGEQPWDEADEKDFKNFKQEPAARRIEQELLERINQEITDWKAAQADDTLEMDFDKDEDDDELKIENIPF